MKGRLGAAPPRRGCQQPWGSPGGSGSGCGSGRISPRGRRQGPPARSGVLRGRPGPATSWCACPGPLQPPGCGAGSTAASSSTPGASTARTSCRPAWAAGRRAGSGLPPRCPKKDSRATAGTVARDSRLTAGPSSRRGAASRRGGRRVWRSFSSPASLVSTGCPEMFLLLPGRRMACRRPRQRTEAASPSLTGAPASAPLSATQPGATAGPQSGAHLLSSTHGQPVAPPTTATQPALRTRPGRSTQEQPGSQLGTAAHHLPGHPPHTVAQAGSSGQPRPGTWAPSSPLSLPTLLRLGAPSSFQPGPGPGTQPRPASKAATESTGNPKQPSVPGASPCSPQGVPPGAEEQALEELLLQFNRTVQAPDRPLVLEGAAQDLENLTGSPQLLSRAAQASASHALLFLSSRLVQDVSACNVSCVSPAGVAAALFRALGGLLQALDTDRPGSSSGSQQQEGAALREALAALPLVQRALLLSHSPLLPESSLTVTSPALSTTLSSCSAASLPHTSYHLPQPTPLTVTFPSASALAPSLSPHSQVQVQVASFALNPFRRLDKMPMDSVASVDLVALEGPIHIQGLAEEIEIELGREVAAEASSPTALAGSFARFGLEVNITSAEDALLVAVKPRGPLQITLCLGSRPHSNSCLLNTTLPRGRWQEEGAYVWVVPPEKLHCGPGTCYISAEVAPGSQGHRDLSISTIRTGCYHWDSQQQAWSSRGCQVGPRSTLGSTHCLCSHLSFFGRVFLVLPHTVNLQQAGRLLSRVGRNPAGLALLSSLLLGYGAAFLWARWRQRRDAGKVKVTLLADNDARACYPYLVQVFTGFRPRASTSAKVTLTLYGAEGRSEAHLLQHPPSGPCLERGGMDAFLLATQKPLGDLHAIRLWHDNSGPSPSWFVHQVTVSALPARQKWHFLCDSWLAADLDDGQLDRVFVAASEKELLSFGHLFWAGLVERLTQEHLWLSVGTCSPWSPFTRLQRLSCCLALLLCSLLIHIMFWRAQQADDDDGPHSEPGPFLVTWQELVVSVEASALLLPLHLLVVSLFQLLQPPALLPLPPPAAASATGTRVLPPQQVSRAVRLLQELTETVGFLHKNRLCQHRGGAAGPWGSLEQVPELVAALCHLACSYLQCLGDPAETPPQGRACHLLRYLSHTVCDLEAQLRGLDGGHLLRPCDHLQAAEQLGQLRQRLQQQQQQPRPSPEDPRSPSCLPTPSSLRSSFPMEDPPAGWRPPLSRQLPRRWGFICWLLWGSTCLLAAFFTVLYSLELSRGQATHWALTILLSLLQSVLLLQPLKALALTVIFSLLRKREMGQGRAREQQLHRALGRLLRERPLPLTTAGRRDWSDPVYRPPTLRLRAQQTQPAEAKKQQQQQLYSLLQEIVVQVAFLAVLMVLSYTERSPSEFYLTDVLQKSFTPQLGRVQTPAQLYSWARSTLVPGVYGDSRGLAMNGNSFLVGSLRLRQIRAEGAPRRPGAAAPLPLRRPSTSHPEEAEEGSTPTWGPPSPAGGVQESAWIYQSEAALQESPVWGKLALYPGSGYLANLGTNASHAESSLRYLEQNRWLDRQTQALFVEFVVYNANVNLFCAVTLLLEANGGGAFLGSAELQILRLYPNTQSLVQLACAHVTFLLLLLYYVLVQGQRLKQQKGRYLGQKENLLDASTLLFSVAAVSLHVKRGLLAKSILRRRRQDRSSFISFYEVVKVDTGLTYLLAFLVALTTVKLWRLLQLNPRMGLITQTLRKAWGEVLGFLLALLVLLVGYAMAVIALDPVLGSLLIFTSVVSMVFVIMNLLVSALLTTFGREMKAAQACKEESMMQLIQLKIALLFGMKRRAAPPTEAPNEAQD
ncbi:polycystic kidney disease protein 1-like 3 isoform X3 [Hemicordylus capensis]|uniref:polycystic kidney disease protein 1-like 3 isoform X3 n=1 Tax=Hemicordylus capensis TaxID=884348 RepID=UPI0023027573|nr:polycystic kidney disease protein 1-like 3 isoform X3 [Hemicordylus capensis]